MKLYVAYWENTFGEYHGVAGVFSTMEKAEEALKRLAPRSYHEIIEMVLDEDGESES